ncbi:MAG TPA: hypothetical protein PLX97_13775, partial [Gemmatales bacterium]|nr:hypothetical protein [Gemmatales bacterium]
FLARPLRLHFWIDGELFRIHHMGITNHLLIAAPSEAEEILASEEPSLTWDGFSCRGLNTINLATLWALAETGSADDGVERRLDAIRTLPEGDEGPWVDIVPPTMLAALAAIATMEDQEQEALAVRWGKTEEMDGWDASEVVDAVRSIGDTAESALLENKTLLIWTSL